MEITLQSKMILFVISTFCQTFIAVTAFDRVIPNVTRSGGTDAVLPCVVEGLQSYERVFWQNKFGVIVSLDNDIVVDDPRITLPKDYANDFSLHIKNVKSSDAGIYQCTKGRITEEVNLIVEVAPSITEKNKIISVFEGDKAMLSCQVDGIPKPVVTWYKESTNLTREALNITGEWLELNNIQRQSAGKYICVGRNKLPPGAERYFDVKVLYQPQMLVTNSRIGQTLGKEIELTCTIESPTEPLISWKYNGSEVASTIKHKIALFFEGGNAYTSALSIIGVEFEDYGEYTCIVANDRGAGIEGTVTLYPLGLPKIFDSTNTGKYFEEGTNVELLCNASGTPVPTIRWYKRSENNIYELINTGSTLTFEAINRTDAGYYRCNASNAFPQQDQRTIMVYVYYQPKIIAPKRVGQILGEDIVLECRTNGYPIPSVTWYKNSDRIVISRKFKRYRIENKEDKKKSTLISYLNITDIVPNDYSSYTCSVENGFGSASAQIKLYNAGTPSIEATTADIKVKEGTDVDLFCNATGIPKPNITWHLMTSYQAAPKIGMGEFLNLPDIKRYQSGTYKCIASNTGPLESYRLTKVTVEYPPEVTVKTKGVSVTTGTSVSIQCRAIGLPRPKVMWHKINSRNATFEHMLEVVQDGVNAAIAKMIIKNMESDAFGSYECIAENKHGQASGITEIKSIVPMSSTTKSTTTTTTSSATTKRTSVGTKMTTTRTTSTSQSLSSKSTKTKTTAAPITTKQSEKADTTSKRTQRKTTAKMVPKTITTSKSNKVQTTTPKPPIADVKTATESTGNNGSSLPKCSLIMTLFMIYFTFHIL